ncbi:tetratricopeptide repeat protein [uncultured Sphaerochaeta sp.]|uniref:tetratricopeptide repeat protein n=1 Tax=uncultured Sphaerochaeta sp. TaxID=886478 RepID=UPI002A0A6138|nr:tetratricopeptide repeat protein [uncultured Sphaerochaeta sp.]
MERSGIDFLIEETRIKASDIFTDREEPRKVFWDHFGQLSNRMHNRNEEQNTPYLPHPILYYGISGIGKTTLQTKLKQELFEKGKGKYQFARYDFDRNGTTLCTREDCIRKLSKQLANNYNFTFFLTELALVKIANASGDDYSRKKATINKMIDDSHVLKPLFIGLNFIPVIGDLINGSLAALEAAETATDKPIMELFQQNKEKYKKYSMYIQDTDVDIIQAHIQTFFAEDLEINLKKAKNPLVIMLDTYEQFINVVGGGGRGSASTIDDWLKHRRTGLIACTPNVLWVICGQDKLISEAPNTEKDCRESSWAAIGLDEYLLGNLSKKDAELYLQKVGIKDTGLIGQLYEVTQGVPVFLDFCYEIFRDIARYPEKQNNIETYGLTPERIIDRYLQGMSDNMLDLIMSMSCLEYWTDNLVAYLRPDISDFSDTTYGNFLTLSLVKQVDNRYFMYSVVRELVFKSIKSPMLITRIRGKAALYFKEKMVEGKNLQEQAGNLASYVLYSLSQCRDDFQALILFKEIKEPLNSLIDARFFEEAKQILALFNGFGDQNKEFEIRIKTIASRIMLVSGKYREAYEVLSSVSDITADISEKTADYLQEGLFTYGMALIKTKPSDKGTLEFWIQLENFTARKYEIEDEKTLQVLNNLAVTYSNLGDTRKALEIYEKVYGLRKRILGDEHPHTLESLNNLANAYFDLGDTRKALEIYEKVYGLRKRILGEEHPDTLTTLNNLANAYSNLGNYRKALEVHEKVYGLRKKIQGEEHPDTLTTLSNLAAVYSDHGDTQKALEVHEKVYELRKRILGDEHPHTLESLNNLAVAYFDLGDTQKALEVHEKVYELSKRILGDEHPDTLISLNNLANAYFDLGDTRKALEVHEKVYKLNKKILGDEHPDTLISLNNLAVAYFDLGDTQKALEVHEKVYGLRKRILGDEHPHTLESLNNLANACSNLGNYRKALEINEKVYGLRKRILGEEHPDTLRSLNNLANAYSDLGNYRKALTIKEKVYGLRKKIQGEEHPDTLRSLNNLANAYSDLGNYRKALEVHEKVYGLRKRILGDEHPHTLRSLNNLANAYSDLGNYRKALEVHEKVYGLRKRILGDEHPHTLRSLNNLANAYSNLGNYRKALEVHEKVYELNKKILGDEHPHTLKSLNNLANAYSDLGDTQKALEVQEKVYELNKKVKGSNIQIQCKT